MRLVPCPSPTAPPPVLLAHKWPAAHRERKWHAGGAVTFKAFKKREHFGTCFTLVLQKHKSWEWPGEGYLIVPGRHQAVGLCSGWEPEE